MNQGTPMEKIKAYHSIKPFLTENQQKEIISMLGLNDTDLNVRLRGKDSEMEFILMIFLLDWCKNIIGFEEGVAKLTNTEAADLLIELKSENKIVVEIKSKEKDSIKISEKLLEKKITFAKSLNANLFFALKLSGHWMLFSSDYIVKHQRKISIQEDFLNSEFNSIFGNRTFIFPKGLKITSVYSKTSKDNMGIVNGDYGNLIRYKIEYNKNKMLVVNSTRNTNFFLVIALEYLQDIASMQLQTIKELDTDRTMIVEEFTEDTSMLNLAAFILSPIRHVMSELGHVYDFNEYLKNIIDNKAKFLTRQHVLYGISFLAERGYPILEKRGNDIYRFKDMIIK